MKIEYLVEAKGIIIIGVFLSLALVTGMLIGLVQTFFK
jgi:hypothetical protein